MSVPLSKLPSSLPSTWFHRSGFVNKKEGVILLKSDTFAPIFNLLQPKFDSLLTELNDLIKPLYAQNKDNLEIPAKKPPKKKSKDVDLEIIPCSDESEDISDDENEPVSPVPRAKDRLKVGSMKKPKLRRH